MQYSSYFINITDSKNEYVNNSYYFDKKFLFGNIAFFFKGNTNHLYSDDDVIIICNGEPVFRDFNSKKMTKERSIKEIYKLLGSNFITEVKGMYSIFIYDIKKEKALLYRDKLGVETLYYFNKDNQVFIATNLYFLMDYFNKKIQINNKIIPSYLYHHYIIAPHTIYENVYKVCAGEKVVIHKNGINKEIITSLVSDYLKTSKSKKISKKIINEKVEKLIGDEIIRFSKSYEDNTIGTFLSGGIDSTLVTTIASKVLKTTINTYSVGFNNNVYDESKYAEKVASLLGTNHKTLFLEEKKMKEIINEMIPIYEEPYADSSQIATYFAYENVVGKSKIILGGDGGDEFFYGYNTFEYNRKIQIFRPFLRLLIAINKIIKIEKIPFLSRKIKSVLDIDNTPDSMSQLYSIKRKKGIYSFVLCDTPVDIRFLIESNFGLKRHDERLIMVHLATSLPDDLMVKIIKPAKHFGFYPKLPLLSDSFINFSNEIPVNKKFSIILGKKKILKTILYKYIPKEMMNRPKKGFSVPLENLIKNYLWEEIINFSTKERIEQQNIFRYETIHNELLRYKNDNNSIMGDRGIYAYYIFQKWYYETYKKT